MLLNPLTFHAPTEISEAAKLFTELENVKIQAGGTFLLNSLKLSKRKGTKTPEHVLSLSKIDELKGIASSDKELTIKAMTTITELSESNDLNDNFAILKQVCKNISTDPIRNMATVGGNLTCRYTWTEMPAAMIGLGAKMHFIDAAGKEEVLEAEDFYKAQAKTTKLFTHLSIARDKNATLAYQRVKKSQGVDIPLLSLMINTHIKDGTLNDTRVGINNCVQFGQRDSKLEEFLNGKKVNDSLPTEALDHLEEEIYDTRSTDYKQHMFRVSIRKALEKIVKGQS